MAYEEAHANPEYNLATPEYVTLMATLEDRLVPNHAISYLPLTHEQRVGEISHLRYLDEAAIGQTVRQADVIICLSRDEDPNTEYDDTQPSRNTVLTASSRANTGRAVDLYNLAKANGNENVRMIVTGRMHNRSVRTMLALPVVGEMLGVDMDTVIHLPERMLETLLKKQLTPEALGRLRHDKPDRDTQIYYDALKSILGIEIGQELPVTEQAVHALIAELRQYPKLSTSQLMRERVLELGVDPSSLYEENGSFDTISSLLYTMAAIRLIEEKEGRPVANVVIVAGSDHLPRTTWIADHIMPDKVNITVVESNPGLNEETYKSSCTREQGSLIKGFNWIKDTRDLKVLRERVEKGYFGTQWKSAEQLAAEIAVEAARQNGA